MLPSGSAPRKGFVDLQVNGYMGFDFSSADLQRNDVHRLTEILASEGTVGYCATIITSALDVYERNLRLLSAFASEPGVKGRLLGIHLEGPYLSPQDGTRGAHSAATRRVCAAGPLRSACSLHDGEPNP